MARAGTDNPLGNAIGWAALGGILAAVAIGIPMTMTGMMAEGPAALVGSDSIAVGWAVHLAAGIVFGAPYGIFARTRDYGRGALLGAGYGLAVGVVFAWLALFTILDMPYLTAMGALDVGMHVVWGIVLGLVTAWGLRRTLGAGARRRRMAGTV